MRIKKFLGLFICAILLTISSTVSSGILTKAIATEPTTIHNVEPHRSSAQNWVAQFGLPSIFDPGIPDIPGAIDSKIDQVESTIRSYIPNVLLPLIPENLFSLEALRLLEFSNYFGRELPEFEQQPSDIRATLENVAQMTGHRYGMVYISYPAEQGLEFMLFSPDSEPQSLYTVDFNQAQIEELATKFRTELFNSLKRNNKDYLATSRTLYNALIAPIDDYLTANQIDSLILSVGQGLRSLPFAALHDGDRYLIQKYSLAMIPSFTTIDSSYMPLRQSPVLAMGAETFPELDPLPGAGLEVQAIADITTGTGLLNEQFTVNNLTSSRQTNYFPIVHMATHAQFNSGKPKDSSIYLWNDALKLNEMGQLQLDNPQVDLLVLSACQTALGSKEAELGFSGLTIASGAKSALGSLWSVSDQGTVMLMQNFYNYLQTESTKSAALRQAQIALLSGDLTIVNGQVRSRSGAPIKIELSDDFKNLNFNQLTHPYYWSGFTLVGQPW